MKLPRLLNLEEEQARPSSKWRNIIAFWIIGLSNNYPYVIMLSAAYDIAHGIEDQHVSQTEWSVTTLPVPLSNHSNHSNQCASLNYTALCENTGTSVILFADILPQLIISLLAPYFMTFIPYCFIILQGLLVLPYLYCWIRVLIQVGFSLASFLFVGLGKSIGLVIFGVVCASISTGFGGISFIALTAYYHKSTVAGWASGTGAAGLFGALAYLGLTFIFTPRLTILIQTIMPVVMLVTFIFLLGKPGKVLPVAEEINANIEGDTSPLIKKRKKQKNKVQFINKQEKKFWWEHVKYIPRLWKYMLPLFVVYVAEYVINQGLFELIFHKNTHIKNHCIIHSIQYRLLQVMYQLGVFLSRSSVGIYHFRWYWVLSVLQVFTLVFFMCATLFPVVLPSFWLTIFIVIWEGLLGGGVYVNAFYTMAIDVPRVHREFSMGIVSAADTAGITVAAGLAHLIRYLVCTFPITNMAST